MSNARIVNPSEKLNKKEGIKMTSQNYDERTKINWLRRSHGIQAFKILKVEDGNITVPLPKVFGEEKTATFKLSDRFDSDGYIVGNYVDLILNYTVYDGSASSFQLEHISLTPPEFFPQYGEPIGN